MTTAAGTTVYTYGPTGGRVASTFTPAPGGAGGSGPVAPETTYTVSGVEIDGASGVATKISLGKNPACRYPAGRCDGRIRPPRPPREPSELETDSSGAAALKQLT